MPGKLSPNWLRQLGDSLANGLLNADQSSEAGIEAQRERVAELEKEDRFAGFSGFPRSAGNRRRAGAQESSGWWVATDGPMTSAPVDWITFWVPG